MWLYHIQQSSDHRGHAPKVARSILAAMNIADKRHLYPSLPRNIIGIHNCIGWQVEDIHALLGQDKTICRHRVWITREILTRTELGRIHINTHRDEISLSSGLSNQFHVAGMDVTHGGHKCDGLPGCACTGNCRVKCPQRIGLSQNPFLTNKPPGTLPKSTLLIRESPEVRDTCLNHPPAMCQGACL